MQAVAFLAPLLSWARTAVDPSYHEEFRQWGRFPLTPREQRSCISGIIAREGVGGKGDEEWQAYLAERGAANVCLVCE